MHACRLGERGLHQSRTGHGFNDLVVPCIGATGTRSWRIRRELVKFGMRWYGMERDLGIIDVYPYANGIKWDRVTWAGRLCELQKDQIRSDDGNHATVQYYLGMCPGTGEDKDEHSMMEAKSSIGGAARFSNVKSRG